jgi:hypothetical protein
LPKIISKNPGINALSSRSHLQTSAIEKRIVKNREAQKESFAARHAFDRQEIKMNASLKAPMVLGFILTVPLFALPAQGAPAHETGHKPAQHRVADFADARAYVSPVTPVSRAPQTDGLSRNAEECSRGGCIDN